MADNILPFIASQHLGTTVLGIFIVGIVAASFSSADSALTSFTTSLCVDILEIKSSNGSKRKEQENTSIRRITHIVISAIFIAIIMIIHAIGSDSIINAIYRIASYTYGPLLGLYFAGLYTKLNPIDKYIPYVAIAAPIICYMIELCVSSLYNYKMGYEMLLINGAITILGIWMLSIKKDQLNIKRELID